MEAGWRWDPVRDADAAVQWRPVIEVSRAGAWAGQAEDGSWVVGRPGQHVLSADSPAGVVALLPLLERPMAQVAADLGAGDLTQHGLNLERVVGAALDERSSPHWTAHAISWLYAGFPTAEFQDALCRVLADKRNSQRARQMAWRILARDFPRPIAPPDSSR
jgi:hypothetical protein